MDKSKKRLSRGCFIGIVDLSIFRNKAFLFASYLPESFFVESVEPNENDTEYLEIYSQCPTREEKLRAHRQCFYDFLQKNVDSYEEYLGELLNVSSLPHITREYLRVIRCFREVLGFLKKRVLRSMNIHVIFQARLALTKRRKIVIDVKADDDEENAKEVLRCYWRRFLILPSPKYSYEVNEQSEPQS